jgi:serine/threonine protein kinase
MIDTMQMVHDSGFIYGDLKLDNLMLKSNSINGKSADLESCSLHLIDFGFSKPYLNRDGTHQELKQVETFTGNLIFSSLNQLDFKSTSRRDDMISISYIIAHLLYKNHLPGMDLKEDQDQIKIFK